MARGQLARAGESTGKLVSALISYFYPAVGAALSGAGGAGGFGSEGASDVLDGDFIDDDATGGGDLYASAPTIEVGGRERVRREEDARNQALVEQLLEMAAAVQSQGG